MSSRAARTWIVLGASACGLPMELKSVLCPAIDIVGRCWCGLQFARSGSIKSCPVSLRLVARAMDLFRIYCMHFQRVNLCWRAFSAHLSQLPYFLGHNMLWDTIWYDTIWYDMIWYDMIWYERIWYLISMIKASFFWISYCVNYLFLIDW